MLASARATSTPAASLPSAWVHYTFGAILIASYVSLIVYGVNIYQAIRYFKTFTNDRRYIMVLVTVVLLFETAHAALCIGTCYHYLVMDYSQESRLILGHFFVRLLPLCQGLLIVTCQIFFTFRVYLLVAGRSRILVVAVVALLTAELGLTAAVSIVAFIQPTLMAFQRFRWMVGAALGTAVVSDGTLTTVLICALRRCKTGMRRTDSLLDSLIIYAITTGLLTGLSVLLGFLFVFIQPEHYTYLSIDIFASVLYPTSLLAALNSRQMLAKHSSGAAAIYGDAEFLSTSTLPPRPTYSFISRRSRANAPNDGNLIEMTVKVDTI